MRLPMPARPRLARLAFVLLLAAAASPAQERKPESAGSLRADAMDHRRRGAEAGWRGSRRLRRRPRVRRWAPRAHRRRAIRRARRLRRGHPRGPRRRGERHGSAAGRGRPRQVPRPRPVRHAGRGRHRGDAVPAADVHPQARGQAPRRTCARLARRVARLSVSRLAARPLREDGRAREGRDHRHAAHHALPLHGAGTHRGRLGVAACRSAGEIAAAAPRGAAARRWRRRPDRHARAHGRRDRLCRAGCRRPLDAPRRRRRPAAGHAAGTRRGRRDRRHDGRRPLACRAARPLERREDRDALRTASKPSSTTPGATSPVAGWVCSSCLPSTTW